jgi:hypothetical protein
MDFHLNFSLVSEDERPRSFGPDVEDIHMRLLSVQ